MSWKYDWFIWYNDQKLFILVLPTVKRLHGAKNFARATDVMLSFSEYCQLHFFFQGYLLL